MLIIAFFFTAIPVYYIWIRYMGKKDYQFDPFNFYSTTILSIISLIILNTQTKIAKTQNEMIIEDRLQNKLLLAAQLRKIDLEFDPVLEIKINGYQDTNYQIYKGEELYNELSWNLTTVNKSSNEYLKELVYYIVNYDNSFELPTIISKSAIKFETEIISQSIFNQSQAEKPLIKNEKALIVLYFYKLNSTNLTHYGNGYVYTCKKSRDLLGKSINLNDVDSEIISLIADNPFISTTNDKIFKCIQKIKISYN
jgi:hypothetical protein